MNSISPLIRLIVAAACVDSIEIIIMLDAYNVPFIVWVRDQQCSGIVSFIKSLRGSAISTVFSIQMEPKELFELEISFPFASSDHDLYSNSRSIYRVRDVLVLPIL